MGSKPNRLAQAGLVLFMAIGSVGLWIAVPLFWLWLGSQLQQSSQPSMGPYLVVIIGIGISVFVLARLLASADRAFARASGGSDVVRVRLPWHRSMRGERDVDAAQPRTILTVVMTISVGLCVLCFGIWFFFFAGSPLPSG